MPAHLHEIGAYLGEMPAYLHEIAAYLDEIPAHLHEMPAYLADEGASREARRSSQDREGCPKVALLFLVMLGATWA